MTCGATDGLSTRGAASVAPASPGPTEAGKGQTDTPTEYVAIE